MSTATDKTVFVGPFDPNAINKQSDLIGPATTSKAGVMTAAQVQALEDIKNGTQTLIFTFDGTQDFLEAPWPVAYSSFALSMAVSAAGGNVVGVNLTKLGDGDLVADNTGVRAVPATRFTGVVYVTSKKVS